MPFAPQPEGEGGGKEAEEAPGGEEALEQSAGAPQAQEPQAEAPAEAELQGQDAAAGLESLSERRQRRTRAARRFAMDFFVPMALAGVLSIVIFYLVLPYLPGALGREIRVKLTERGSIPYLSTIFLCWHLCHVLFRYVVRVRPEFKVLAADLIPAGSSEITNEDLQLIAQRAVEMEETRGGSLLTRRLLLAVAHLSIRRDIAELGDLLRRRAEADRARAANAYAIPNFIFWAIPILGFIGTVLGIGLAVGDLSQGLGDIQDAAELGGKLKGVAGNLSIAFDTTLVALLMSMVAYLTQTLVRQQEAQLLADVEDYLTYRLQSRIKTETSEDRMEAIMKGALSEMTGVLRSITAESQKNSRLTMQTMMTAQQSLRNAIDKFPEMLKTASETSAKMLADTSEKGSQLLAAAATASSAAVEEMKEKLQEVVQALAAQISQSFKNVSASLEQVASAQAKTGEAVAKGVADAAKLMATEASVASAKLGGEFRAIAEKLATELRSAAQGVRESAEAAAKAMAGAVQAVGAEARSQIELAGSAFLDMASGKVEALYEKTAASFAEALAPVRGFLEQIVASIEKALEEGEKLAALQETLARNLREVATLKKLDEALEGLRFTLGSLAPVLDKLREPVPLRVTLAGMELPVAAGRRF